MHQKNVWQSYGKEFELQDSNFFSPICLQDKVENLSQKIWGSIDMPEQYDLTFNVQNDQLLLAHEIMKPQHSNNSHVKSEAFEGCIVNSDLNSDENGWKNFQDLDKPLKKIDHRFSSVFKRKRQITIKNSNVSKYLLRKIVQWYGYEGKKFFNQHYQLKNQMKRFVQCQRKNYRNDKSWNHNLTSIRKFYDLNPKSHNPKLRSFLMRKMTHYLIRSQIIPDLFKTSFIKGRHNYLFALKIQRLRCRNQLLMQRTQVS